MGTGTGLRVIVAERKSRKPSQDKAEAENARYRRQENKNIRTAEASGHAIIERVADTVTSQSLPWQRKNLKTWFTDPAKLALWDAVLISEVARLSRGDSDTWYEIEQWCRTNGKCIMDSTGLTWPSADDKDWDDKRRAAREYWESVRDSHADVHADILAARAATGRPPYGYRTAERPDGYKMFVPDEVTAPLATEAFQRIADGKTASSVAAWLTELTGALWRVKRVADMIRRDSYRADEAGNCHRYTHEYQAIIPRDLYDKANAALAGRSFSQGGRNTVHAYSSLVLCSCGSKLVHHQSSRNGQPVGTAKYRCSRGRRGIPGEETCGNQAIAYDAANAMVDEVMSRCEVPETVRDTTGGDTVKRLELKAIKDKQRVALESGDMAALTALVREYEEAEARETQPIRTVIRETGRTLADVWSGTIADRRSLLESGLVNVIVTPDHASLVLAFGTEQRDGEQWIKDTVVTDA